MPEKSGDFETFAKVALGTDDPERLAAFKEAVMACMSAEEEGEYDEEMAAGEGADLASLMGGG
jgi:hypothetical protein